ncbi:hypothetical protein Y1Q_0021596 [Alligator mississippiensis]|uniref:Uncharacterized protein n=1 Tax=Alligator mississippiensis TaxID=8496 RepID=A0A151PB85_ALLMI|nr:hypothetical protein Y1Q_0021596 [Alligator mississippiensis]
MVGWRCQLFAPKEFTFYTGTGRQRGIHCVMLEKSVKPSEVQQANPWNGQRKPGFTWDVRMSTHFNLADLMFTGLADILLNREQFLPAVF